LSLIGLLPITAKRYPLPFPPLILKNPFILLLPYFPLLILDTIMKANLRVKILSNVEKPHTLFPAYRLRKSGISIFCANELSMNFTDSNNKHHFSKFLPKLCNFKSDLIVLFLESYQLAPNESHIFSQYVSVFQELSNNFNISPDKLLLIIPPSVSIPLFQNMVEKFPAAEKFPLIKPKLISLKQLIESCDIPALICKTFKQTIRTIGKKPKNNLPLTIDIDTTPQNDEDDNDLVIVASDDPNSGKIDEMTYDALDSTSEQKMDDDDLKLENEIILE